MEKINTTLLLTAGGKGLRMGSEIPKQFLSLQGKPLLYYPIKAFIEAFPEGKIILVLPQDHFSYANILLKTFHDDIDLTIAGGGISRFHSVKNGLNLIEKGIVFIHDAVRPFLNKDLLMRCYIATLNKGNAIPATAITDSVRQWDGHSFKAINRNNLKSMQTPQTFEIDLIKRAFEQPYDEAFTDEATLLEHIGISINIVEGFKNNIKITTPEDMVMAEALMQTIHNA